MRDAIIFILVGALVGFFLGYKYYNSKVADLTYTVSSLSEANEKYQVSTEKQNNKVLSLRIAADYRRKEYEDLLEKPETIKYIKLKSNNCEDVGRVLDDIRTSGF
jgi:hypothetical protein